MKKIQIERINEIVYEHELSNGFKIYIWPYKMVSDIYLTLTIKYGSIDTTFELNNKKINVPNGMAHFLEHIKFNEEGTTAHEYFYKLGSYTNAYTTFDHTSYEVMCNNNVKDNLNHLLYFVTNNYFTKELINKEKPIIIEETKMTKDNPYNEGYFELLNSLFNNDNHKNLVTGEEEDIKNITIEDAQNVFEAFYTPNNMFLTVTGNVNPYEIIKICEEFFENSNNNEVNVKKINPKENKKVNKKESIIYTNVTKEKLFYGVKIDRKRFKEFDDLHLRIYLNIMLDINFGQTSSFNEHIINNHLADDLSYAVMVNKDYAILIFESSSSYPKEMIKLLNEKLDNLEFSKEDFERKNRVYIASGILGYEDAFDVNNEIRNNIIRYNKIINNIPSIFENLKINDGKFIIDNLGKERCYVILKPKKKK